MTEQLNGRFIPRNKVRKTVGIILPEAYRLEANLVTTLQQHIVIAHSCFFCGLFP
jgi:hypothetical protein